MIKYIIIENDNSIIQNIQRILSYYNKFSFQGSFIVESDIIEDGFSHNIDLVFINIDQSSEILSEIVKAVKNNNILQPKLIAISMNKENAYRAFKLGFYNFMLLPLNDNELSNSINKLLSLNFLNRKQSICIKSYKDFQFVDLDSIIYLKADNNTSDFFLKDSAVVSAYKTLKTFENLLPSNFIRIHRSYMVNINYITRVQYGKNMCTVKHLNSEIPFSKSYLLNVEKMMQFLTNNSV